MSDKLSAKVCVKNMMGLHTRPATVIVKLLQNCKSDVFFTYKRETINAKSILSILMLAAKKNSKITITVEGDDADTTLKSLIAAFENQFGECREWRANPERDTNLPRHRDWKTVPFPSERPCLAKKLTSKAPFHHRNRFLSSRPFAVP